jgi:hypothetical protein
MSATIAVSFLQTVIATLAFGWLAVVAAIIVLGFLNGEINIDRLLNRKYPTHVGDISAERVQLLIVTIVAGGTYLGRLATLHGLTSLPPVDNFVLSAAGASNGIYLVTKLGTHLKAWLERITANAAH